MRELIADKLGEDQLVNVKNKEKNVALFNEVVRIGQELDRQSGQLQSLILSVEGKFQAVDTRLSKSEQDASNAERTGNTLNGMLASVTEKTETRLNQLEGNVELIVVS